FKYKNTLDLYQDIASGKISLKKIKGQVIENGELSFSTTKTAPTEPDTKSTKSSSKIPDDTLFIGDDEKDVPYKIAPCCNPIPGDDVFGFVTINDGIKIHRMNCPNAVQLRSNYAYRVIKAKWQSQKDKEFLANVLFKGIDDVGL